MPMLAHRAPIAHVQDRARVELNCPSLPCGGTRKDAACGGTLWTGGCSDARGGEVMVEKPFTQPFTQINR